LRIFIQLKRLGWYWTWESIHMIQLKTETL
jgi:hypothetical protein